MTAVGRDETRERLCRWSFCLIVAFVTLAICSKSSFLYPLNDWSDANAYFSVGKGMLRGRVVYRDLYEHKGPLLYALHALACLISSDTFIGVFVLEVLAATAFLAGAYDTLRIFGLRRSAYWALPVLAVLIYSSVSFQQGDSAEELCLPLLMWALNVLLRAFRQNDALSAKALLLHGALCGCILWTKFTLLGLYGAWILAVFIRRCAQKQPKQAFAAIGWFALGIALATIPWLLYFGVNGAIGDWLKTYLYDNIFLYSGNEAGAGSKLRAIAAAGWDWLTVNWAYSALIVLGLLWTAFNKAFRGKLAYWGLAACTALGVFVGGKAYLYYGFPLAVFAVLGFVPLLRPVEAWASRKRGVSALVATALVLGSGGLCYAASPNVPELGKARLQTMQYRMAEHIDWSPDATLLNYNFMDAGFYTAFRIVPSVKYFHRTNTNLREMLDEQARYIRDGATDYVISRQPLDPELAARYELIATDDTPAGFWYEHVYLYELRHES